MDRDIRRVLLRCLPAYLVLGLSIVLVFHDRHYEYYRFLPAPGTVSEEGGMVFQHVDFQMPMWFRFVRSLCLLVVWNLALPPLKSAYNLARQARRTGPWIAVGSALLIEILAFPLVVLAFAELIGVAWMWVRFS